MSRLNLTSWQKRRLQQQLSRTQDARLFRRTLTLLEFDRGRSAAELARMLRVSRQSVYNWVVAYLQTHDPAALEEDEGRGRPRLLDEDGEHLLAALLTGSPQDFGFAHTSWTIPLLRQALEICTDQRVSADTLRRALHRLDYVWKRPRYDLLPDPEAEKKKAHPQTNPGFAATQRRAGRGRDRPAAVPALARHLGQARRRPQGLAERPQRPASDIRGNEPDDRETLAHPP